MASAIAPFGAPGLAESEDVPEELTVEVAPAVVSNRCPDRFFRHLVEAMQQVLDRKLGELSRRLRALCSACRRRRCGACRDRVRGSSMYGSST